MNSAQELSTPAVSSRPRGGGGRGRGRGRGRSRGRGGGGRGLEGGFVSENPEDRKDSPVEASEGFWDTVAATEENANSVTTKISLPNTTDKQDNHVDKRTNHVRNINVNRPSNRPARRANKPLSQPKVPPAVQDIDSKPNSKGINENNVQDPVSVASVPAGGSQEVRPTETMSTPVVSETKSRTRRQAPICHFYNSGRGCMKGEECRFRHVEKRERGDKKINVDDTLQSRIMKKLENDFLNFTIEDEKWRLERMFRNSFRLLDIPNGSGTVISFVIVPSDPDAPRHRIPAGIKAKISFPLNYPNGFLNSVLNGTDSTSLKDLIPKLEITDESLSNILIDNIPLKFEDLMKIQCERWIDLKLKEDSETKNRKDKTSSQPKDTPWVFAALRLLDRELLPILQEDLNSTISVSSPEELQPVVEKGPWTSPEQKKLEDALVYFRRYKDPKLKWKMISEFVQTRSVKECALRYKECREALNLLVDQAVQQDETDKDKDKDRDKDRDIETGISPGQGQKNEIDILADGGETTESKEVEESSSEESSDEDESSSLESAEESAEGQTSMSNILDLKREDFQGQEIWLSNPDFKGLSAVVMSKLDLLITCGRCFMPVETTMFVSSTSNLEEKGSTTSCAKCHQRVLLKYLPKIGTVSNPILVKFFMSGARIKDFLPSSFFAMCENCSTYIKWENVYPGTQRTVNCRHCYKPVTFCHQGCKIVGKAPTFTLDDEAPVPVKIKKKVEKQILRVGEPLPANGACKHYKKSFRWFRFPCCGKAYPCDECHDSAEDHPNDMASRMICGFCSKEQPCSSKPCICGASLTGPGSSHWEGGKGCRNPLTMSKKDDKKYKLLSKQKKKLKQIS